MSLNIDQIAEAFCSHRFVVTYPYMDDKIKWNIVGREELMGREAVIDRCDKSAKFLATVSATITKTKLDIHRAERFVVVEGAAQFQGAARRIGPASQGDNAHLPVDGLCGEGLGRREIRASQRAADAGDDLPDAV